MLETSRIQLVPLTHPLLLLFKNNPRELAKELSLNYIERENDPKVVADIEEAIEFWINGTYTNPTHFKWFTNWEIILKHERIAIGGVGFAGLPDEKGQSMLGYGLDIRYHQRGYATEAVRALLAWGFSHAELKSVSAETPVSNISSQRVLVKNGFIEINRDDKLIHWQLIR